MRQTSQTLTGQWQRRPDWNPLPAHHERPDQPPGNDWPGLDTRTAGNGANDRATPTKNQIGLPPWLPHPINQGEPPHDNQATARTDPFGLPSDMENEITKARCLTRAILSSWLTGLDWEETRPQGHRRSDQRWPSTTFRASRISYSTSCTPTTVRAVDTTARRPAVSARAAWRAPERPHAPLALGMIVLPSPDSALPTEGVPLSRRHVLSRPQVSDTPQLQLDILPALALRPPGFGPVTSELAPPPARRSSAIGSSHSPFCGGLVTFWPRYWSALSLGA
jgi:hypothetical protein